MKDEICPLSDKIGSFIVNPDAGIVAGKRRMGTEALLDTVADRISGDPDANVIRVKDENDAMEYVRSAFDAGKKNHVLLYVEIPIKESDGIIAEFPGVQIYRVKELCHQVPACFKESSAGINR